jgi:hypothetical protein
MLKGKQSGFVIGVVMRMTVDYLSVINVKDHAKLLKVDDLMTTVDKLKDKYKELSHAMCRGLWMCEAELLCEYMETGKKSIKKELDETTADIDAMEKYFDDLNSGVETDCPHRRNKLVKIENGKCLRADEMCYLKCSFLK